MSDASDSPSRPFGSPFDSSQGRAQGRRLGARTYIIGAVILFVIPGIGGGGVWWLYAQKAAVDRAFTQPVREFKERTGECLSVTIGPDGQALSGDLGYTVRLWDIETGAEVRVFKGHLNRVTSVTFGPDGRRALSGSWDRTLRLWDLETGEPIREFVKHTVMSHSVAFGPDGRRALSGSQDGTIRLWDVETGAELGRFVQEKRNPGLVASVAFAPDGQRALAAGSMWIAEGQWEPELILWRVPTNTELKIWRLMGGKFPEPPEKRK